VSISLACLIAGAVSCKGDTVVREDAGRADRPASSKPSSSGGSSLASLPGSSVGGSSGEMSSSSAASGGSSSQSSDKGGSGGAGGASASRSSSKGGARPDGGSTTGSSTGRIVDAAVVDAPAGEVGPLACDDKTSTNRLGVYYYTGSPGAEVQDVQIHMALINFTAFTTRLSQTTVRYWFTDEEPETPNMLTMYYTPTTLAKITTRFLPATPPRAGANTVLEFSFTPNPDAGASFVETMEFNFAFHKDGYSGTYSQANDYSFDSKLSKSFGPNPRITAYIGGQLAWGCEPPVVASTDAGTD
jgi:hypothetical protein